MVRDPDTKKVSAGAPVRADARLLAECVRLLTWRSSAQIWAALHEQAFRRLGGTVRAIVLDNLGEGVVTPDIYDPALNPLYRDVLAHYGVIAWAIPIAKGSRRRGRSRAEDAVDGPMVRDARGSAGVLGSRETHWPDTRIHGATKRQVVLMFC